MVTIMTASSLVSHLLLLLRTWSKRLRTKPSKMSLPWLTKNKRKLPTSCLLNQPNSQPMLLLLPS